MEQQAEILLSILILRDQMEKTKLNLKGTYSYIRVDNGNQTMKISNSPVGLWFMGTNTTNTSGKGILNHFKQLFFSFLLFYELNFFGFCTDSQYFVRQGTNKRKFFAFSTSICTHKPQYMFWFPWSTLKYIDKNTNYHSNS